VLPRRAVRRADDGARALQHEHARRRTRHGTEVVSVVYGMPGWLERLGLRSARQCEVAWRDVVRIERDRVIVRTRR
jgi:hypothetical protein